MGEESSNRLIGSRSLWYLQCSTDEGTDASLMCWAISPHDAVRLWLEYYADWEFPDSFRDNGGLLMQLTNGGSKFDRVLDWDFEIYQGESS